MKFPFLRTSAPGWTGVVSESTRLVLAHVVPGAERGVVSMAHEAPGGEKDLASLRKTLGLGKRRAVTLMQPGAYQLIQLEAPTVPREEWREAIRWKLKDLLDFPVDQAVCDVLDIPTEEYAPGRPRQCFAVVARRDAVSARVSGLLEAGLDLAAVDIPELALRNVAAVLAEENRAIALLGFDEKGAFLVVCFKGELYSSRRIEVSPEQLRSGDTERVQQLCERIALETQRTLDGFDRQYSFMTISRLVVAAWDGAEALREALVANLYVPVELMDLSGKFDFSGAPQLQTQEAQARWLLVLGAALREGVAQGQQINLFDTSFKPRRDMLSLENIALAGGVTLLVVAGTAAMETMRHDRQALRLQQADTNLRMLQGGIQKLAQLQADQRIDGTLESTLADRQQVFDGKQAVVAFLDTGKAGSRQGFAPFMEGIARQIGEGAWLTGFDIAAGGQQVALRGGVLNESALPKVIVRLQSEEVFRGRQFSALQMRRVEPKALADSAGKDGKTREMPEKPPYVEFVLGGVVAATGERAQ